MRLAVVGKVGSANAYYRAVLPLSELRRRGHAVELPTVQELHALRSRPAWDLVHIQQLYWEDDFALIRKLLAMGLAVSWDTDDDIAATPRDVPAWKELGKRRGIRRVFKRSVEIARSCHLLTTTNEHLAGIYRDAGVEHVAVIENYVARVSIVPPGPPRRRVVIGCCAAREHLADHEQLRLAAALSAIMRDRPEVRVMTIGLPLDLPPSRHVNHRTIPIERLIETEQSIDIGIAPLVDSAVNRSRSNIKVKEYAAAGAMWLASPIGPYVGLGEEQGGLLVDAGAWRSTLLDLIDAPERRAELAARAHAWVRRETIEHAGGQWESAFRSAIDRAQAPEGALAG